MSLPLPDKYVERKTMLDLGWGQLGCNICGEAVWWVWFDGDLDTHAILALVCKSCGQLSPRFLVTPLDS